MNTGTPLWKDVFLSKDDTLKIAEGFIEALFPNPLEDRTDHLVRFYTDSHIRESIEVIFKFSESPIETIFLNALHFYSLLESPFFFMFAPPLVSANVQVSNYRSFYFRIKQMWEEYQQKSGEQSIEQFLASTLNRADLSREVK